MKLLRLARGYVLFGAYSGFNEKFVNLCVENGITLWDISVSGRGVTAATYVSDYKKLRNIARLSGARLKLRKRCGLPFFINKNKQRVGFPVGILIFFLLLYILSSMIWTVEVDGDDTLYKDSMIEIMSDFGVRPGAFKSHISSDEVEQGILLLLENEIYWASLNIEGSCARLEIRELPDIEMRDSLGLPCNVVADFDGVVVGMSIMGGKAGIKVGSAVRSGDLLVSGVIENKDGTTSLYEADAEIVAMRERSFYVDLNNDIKKLSVTDNAYEIEFFAINIPILGFEPNMKESFYEKRCLNIASVKLPVGFSCSFAVKQDSVQLDEEKRRLIALSELFMTMNTQLRNTSVLSQYIDINGINVSYKAQCLDYIGVQKEIVTGEIPDNTQ